LVTACDDITLTKLAFPDASSVSVGQRRTTEMGKAWYISDVGWMWGGMGPYHKIGLNTGRVELS